MKAWIWMLAMAGVGLCGCGEDEARASENTPTQERRASETRDTPT